MIFQAVIYVFFKIIIPFIKVQKFTTYLILTLLP